MLSQVGCVEAQVTDWSNDLFMTLKSVLLFVFVVFVLFFSSSVYTLPFGLVIK